MADFPERVWRSARLATNPSPREIGHLLQKGTSVKTIRSFFIGSLAMIAACFIMVAPSAADYEGNGGLYSASFQLPDMVFYDEAPHVAILAEKAAPAQPSSNDDAAAYTVANQPLSAWRISADAYRHIDPHIDRG